MGQQVAHTVFEQRDFARFGRALAQETQALHDLQERGDLSQHAPVAGLELEAWLIDAQGRPAPRNDEFIARLGEPEVVTELGRFNIELNLPPRSVRGRGLQQLADDLVTSWQRCCDNARAMGLQVLAIGILPTLRDSDLSLANMSDRERYRALNQQVLRQRHGRAITLDIAAPGGGPPLRSQHHDVMLEAAATSFQVHLQLPAQHSVRAYNAAIIASGPLLAATANSPLLFGRRLWQETRIAVFEQALNIGTRELGEDRPLPRVGFGSGYAGYSLVECFRENLQRFEPLLPLALDEPAARLPHLRLHNGTIWRWNRPLVGFDDDGTPHLRVEHRPMAAGPSLPDMVANLALALGLAAWLAQLDEPPEQRLPFEAARANFYAAAQHGLQAPLQWLDGRVRPANELLLALQPQARQGLQWLQVDEDLIDGWLRCIQDRVLSGRTGAQWQLARLDALGGDLAALTLDCARWQAEGEPAHRWPV